MVPLRQEATDEQRNYAQLDSIDFHQAVGKTAVGRSHQVIIFYDDGAAPTSGILLLSGKGKHERGGQKKFCCHYFVDFTSS
jgi:hypothetical protein